MRHAYTASNAHDVHETLFSIALVVADCSLAHEVFTIVQFVPKGHGLQGSSRAMDVLQGI
jgi:hypothetical protein